MESRKARESYSRRLSKCGYPMRQLVLKIRLTVEAHCVKRGRRVYDATVETINQSYWWSDVKEDFKEFMQAWIHCIVSRTGEQIPWPVSNASHGSKRKEVVHADVFYIGPGWGCDLMHVLLIGDDISSYTWLHPCVNVDSDAATSTLFKWIPCFRCMERLLTCQGSHFVASLMSNLTREWEIRNHLTTSYCPLPNRIMDACGRRT